MEEQEQDPHYTKGFNSGYLIAKHEPELAKQLAANPNNQSAFFKGLLGGKEQHEKEMNEWAKSFSRGGSSKDEREVDRDR